MPRRCLHGVHPMAFRRHHPPRPLPRRCLHGVHPTWGDAGRVRSALCLGAACTGCIRRCFLILILTLLCLGAACTGCICNRLMCAPVYCLCLGAACTGCIIFPWWAWRTARNFASALPARGASRYVRGLHTHRSALPRRCLHGVHRGGQRAGVQIGVLCLGAACTGCIVTI